MRAQERIILVGTNGTGKSTFADAIINACITGVNKKALEVLPDDSEPIFRNDFEVKPSELKYISNIAAKRCKVYFDSPKIFKDILLYFKNGVLILDDARYYSGSFDDDLRKIFIRSRQNNVDIVFICHGLSEIPPSLITFATKIVLFNTVDSWQRLKNKIPNPNQFEKYVNEIRAKANDHKKTPFLAKDGKRYEKCNAYNRERCNCGAAYVKKTIDVKRDLIQAVYE